MGKVKDDVSTSKASKPPKGKTGGVLSGTFALFLLNLLQTELYKPMQGWYARLYTALGLGVVAAAGVWRGYESSIDYTPLWRLGIPGVLALGLGWLIFRIIHFPPFAEFLIATEAEMNKVSWTSKEDLYRATTVVSRPCCSWPYTCSWSTGSGSSSSGISVSSSSPGAEDWARPRDFPPCFFLDGLLFSRRLSHPTR